MNQGQLYELLREIRNISEALDEMRRTLNRMDGRLKVVEAAQTAAQERKTTRKEEKTHV